MAKKTTRARKQLAQQRAIQQAAANVALSAFRPDAPAVAPESSGAPVAQARADRLAEFTEEYHRVRSDLKRIGLLAGSITAVLIALSFLI
jgi:hypothetical protein